MESLIFSAGSSDKYTFFAAGLFPSPEKNNLNKWFSLGRMVAKAIMDFHIVSLPAQFKIYFNNCKGWFCRQVSN